MIKAGRIVASASVPECRRKGASLLFEVAGRVIGISIGNVSRGDIKAKMFSMEEGAQLSGRTEIG